MAHEKMKKVLLVDDNTSAREALSLSTLRTETLSEINAQLQVEAEIAKKTIDGFTQENDDMRKKLKGLLKLYDEKVKEAALASAGETRAVQTLSMMQDYLDSILSGVQTLRKRKD